MYTSVLVYILMYKTLIDLGTCDEFESCFDTWFEMYDLAMVNA